MGEAARLWLILMPWAAWLSAGYFETALDPLSPPEERRVSLWPAFAFLTLQLLVCLGTVTRVTGFRWS